MGNLTVKESGEMINFISPNVSKITSFKVYFSPRQEGSSDPSPENVREITGWNGVEGYSCGKNLFGGEAFEQAVSPSRIYEDAQYGKYLRTYNVTTANSIFIMPFKKNTQYTFIGKIRREGAGIITGLKIKYTDGSTSHLFSDTSSEANEIVTVRMVSAKNKTIDGLYYLQRTVGCHIFFNDFGIFEGDVSIDNFKPYQGATTTTDWTDDVGTVYGGYVDLISGELVQTWQLRQISELGIKKTSGTGIWEHRFDMKYWVTGYGYETSGTFKCLTDCFTLGLADHNNSFLTYVGNLSVYDDTVSTADEFKAKYGQNYVAYEIKSDLWQTYQLTPQQLSTLKGQNNFWSNADYIEIEYELTETFDIQKAKRKIILNQPHVESASGDIVTFDTDMKGKLKECKVYFSPVQEGEGDPSPDNVREITGWSGVEVIQTNQNLIRADDPNNPTLNYRARSSYNYIVYSEEEQAFTERDTIEHVGGGINEANHARINATKNDQARLFIAPKDGIYTFTCDYKNVGTNYGLRFYKVIDGVSTRLGDIHGDADELWHTRSFTVELNKGDSFRVYLYSNIYWRNFRVIEGDGTDYIENVTNDYSISWTDSAGTIYGGYVDLVSGELVVNRCFLENENWTEYKRNNGFVAYRLSTIPTPKGANQICKPISNIISNFKNFLSNNMTENVMQINGTTLYVALAEGIDASEIQLSYELAEPITYQLTPQQLTTLHGINNIWSSANGEVEIKYWKH